MEVDRNSREVLDRAGCLRLLSRATLGRLAFTSGTPPSVVPVRYHLDGDRILVRTRRGGRLDAALSDPWPRSRSTTSNRFTPRVERRGHWRRCGGPRPIELEDAREEPVDRWTASPGDVLVTTATFPMGRSSVDPSPTLGASESSSPGHHHEPTTPHQPSGKALHPPGDARTRPIK
jgi:hypothetical protein